MPPPNANNKKTINHRDTQYRWIIWNKTTHNELAVELSASVNGQLLLAELPRVVNDAMVTGAIDFARKHGWQPEVEQEPFRCKYTRRGWSLPGTGADPQR
jgi:hypothetical protein